MQQFFENVNQAGVMNLFSDVFLEKASQYLVIEVSQGNMHMWRQETGGAKGEEIFEGRIRVNAE
jgi:hypothetical protein